MFSSRLQGKTLRVAGLVLISTSIVAAGCNKGGGGGGGDSALITSGKAVYDKNGCKNCHSIDGQGGRKAPELTHVGAESTHTPEWLVAHIKNPRTHNPQSRMPGFAGKISDQDLLALGAYLASLK